MPRINRIEKSRKELKCSKCGKILPKGSTYLKATPFHRDPIIRCTDCGIKFWETSTSEYVRSVGQIQDEWESTYGTDYEAIKEALEELMDNCQESLDEIPENLQYGPTGEKLQERIDNLETVIAEFDNIDEDSIRSDCEEQYRSDNDLDEECDLSEVDDSGEIDEMVERALNEAIEEALGYLE